MYLTLTQRLFLPILFTSIFLVFIMAVSVRYSFHQGFLEYVNHSNVKSVEGLISGLAEVYEQQNNWEFLRGNSPAWKNLQKLHFKKLEREYAEHDLSSKEGKLVPPRVRIGPRLTLLDAEEEIVVGNPTPDPSGILLSIVSKGKTVGWLNINPSTNLSSAVDIKFKEQQMDAVYIVVFVCVFIAIVVAIILARHLGVPVKRLGEATRVLTAGDYSTRAEETYPHVDDMGRLQRDFNFLANTLQKNEDSRRQWIADISHELRTPIAVLRGEVEALQDGVRDANEESLKSLHSEILHISQIIDDLYQLSMSDIGALNYRKEELNIAQLLEDTISSFNENLAQQNIAAKIDLDTCLSKNIFADQQRLRQLFTNLMQNTLRYTNAGGELKVWCEARENELTINWQDSEPGVSDEILPQLFERLFRTDESRCRQTGGAGLGLSICKNIVEAHDGKIRAQHSPLGGLWFTIELPID